MYRLRFLALLLIFCLLLSLLFAWVVFPEVIVDPGFLGLNRKTHFYLNKELLSWLAGISAILVAVAGFIWFRLGNKPILADNKAGSKWNYKKLMALLVTLCSIGFYIVGILTPLYYSQKFFVLKQEVSLLESIQVLIQYNETYLAVLIVVFTLVFPMLKFLLIFVLLFVSRADIFKKLSHWISHVSKWSMLDVFILSILLINMKFGSRLLDMELRGGIVWFSLSIIGVMIAMEMIIPWREIN